MVSQAKARPSVVPSPLSMRSKWGRSVACVLVAAVSLAGCSGDAEPAATETATVTPPSQMDKTSPPEPVLEIVWPLTGVPVEKLPQRPAVAIKVENTSSSRPQSGLEDADVVWETIVEFDVSRFVAVFHSTYPKEVGPLRSVRPMDRRIVSPLDGVFVFSGAQAGILRQIRQTDELFPVDENNAAGSMWRSPNRFAPHNLYGNVKEFAEIADASHSDSPQEQFAFARGDEKSVVATEGKKIKNLSLRLSTASAPSWRWDSASKTFLRSEGGAPHYSAAGDQLSAVNVVVVEAEHFDSGFNAQNDAVVPDYRLKGEGKATVITQGRVLEGTWRKKKMADPLTLWTKDGEPLTLAHGNTWVELLPKGKGSLAVE